MNPRVLAVLGAIVLIAAAAGGTAWWWPVRPMEMPDATPGAEEMPVPPFPPRIAEGDQYDKCMTMLADDPEGAEAIAESWADAGGGDAAQHCQALSEIAAGDPESGADLLEEIAHSGRVSGLTRAVLLSQAAEARLMAEQWEQAQKDATEALSLSPDDPDLLIERASAEDSLDKQTEAMDDLNEAIRLDDQRGEALTMRASIWRRMDMLPEARSDIDKALALDPDDAEALLERGILRQSAGDLAGARADWEHARDAEPESEAAELAAQNLTLLDAGPEKK